MDRWHCLYHCTAGSSTSLMEIRTYDPRSMEPLLYNLSYPVIGPETVLLIAGLAALHRELPKLLDQEAVLVHIHLNVNLNIDLNVHFNIHKRNLSC